MNGEHNDCRCGGEREHRPMACHTPAMVCPPEQYWGQLYTPEEGLEVGTLFECLHLPFDPMCRNREWQS